MDQATLTISLPRTMKEFIATKLREGRFSTPSEYIRSLIRDDQELAGNKDLALLLRRTLVAGTSKVPGALSPKTAARRRKEANTGRG